jgi:hypothetical protein
MLELFNAEGLITFVQSNVAASHGSAYSSVIALKKSTQLRGELFCPHLGTAKLETRYIVMCDIFSTL